MFVMGPLEKANPCRQEPPGHLQSGCRTEAARRTAHD